MASDRLGGVAAFRLAAAIVAVRCPSLVALPRPNVGVARAVGLAFAVAASTFCPLLLLGIWWRGLTPVRRDRRAARRRAEPPRVAVAWTLGADTPSGWAGRADGAAGGLVGPLAVATMVGVALLTPAPGARPRRPVPGAAAHPEALSWTGADGTRPCSHVRLILIRHRGPRPTWRVRLDPGPRRAADAARPPTGRRQPARADRSSGSPPSTPPLIRTQLTAAPLAAARGPRRGRERRARGDRRRAPGDEDRRRLGRDVRRHRRRLDRAVTSAATMPGGADGHGFFGRYAAAVGAIAAAHADDATVVAFSHGAAIRTFAARHGGRPARLLNTGAVVLEGSPYRGWGVTRWSRDPLGGAAPHRRRRPWTRPATPTRSGRQAEPAARQRLDRPRHDQVRRRRVRPITSATTEAPTATRRGSGRQVPLGEQVRRHRVVQGVTTSAGRRPRPDERGEADRAAPAARQQVRRGARAGRAVASGSLEPAATIVTGCPGRRRPPAAGRPGPRRAAGRGRADGAPPRSWRTWWPVESSRGTTSDGSGAAITEAYDGAQSSTYDATPGRPSRCGGRGGEHPGDLVAGGVPGAVGNRHQASRRGRQPVAALDHGLHGLGAERRAQPGDGHLDGVLGAGGAAGSIASRARRGRRCRGWRPAPAAPPSGPATA